MEIITDKCVISCLPYLSVEDQKIWDFLSAKFIANELIALHQRKDSACTSADEEITSQENGAWCDY